MKQDNPNRDRTLMRPIKIDLSEAEIMADLQYPAVIERPATTRPPEKRNPST